MNRLGLLIPAAIASAAALVATALPDTAAVLAGAALLAAVAGGLAAIRSRSRGAVLVTVSAAATVAVLAAVLVGELRRHPAGVPVGTAADATLQVEEVRTLSSNDHAGALTERRLLRGTLVAVPGRDGLAVPVVLFGDRIGAPAPGALVRVRVVLHRAEPTDQAAAIGSALGAARTVRGPPPFQVVAARLRAGFVRATARLPGDGGALLPGLAIGDTTRVDAGLTQAMRDASLTHLTAVSGANCAVVTAGVLALGGLLRLPRGVRIGGAGAALLGFVVLVTPQPSVVRAALMATIALACVLAGRRTTGPPALGLTVLVLVLLNPWIVWSAGFVLSVAATAGLLLLVPPIAGRLGRVLPHRVAVVVAVPIAAQVACQPVLVLLQPGVPVFGVLANLLAEPAAPLVTVLGLLACLVGAAAPPLGAGLAVLAWVPAAWIGVVARVVGRLPQLDWLPGAAGALLAGAVLVAGVLVVAGRGHRAIRVSSALILAAAVLVVAGSAVGGAIGRVVGTPRDWTFAACDVGQGDGLVLNGGGRYAVVDTGRDAEPILHCLDRLGVRRVDLLVLTHWDADHVGAARAVLPRVREAIVGPTDGPAAVALRRDVARAAPVHQARRGDEVHLGTLRLSVLWPPDPLGDVEPGNAASITLMVTGGPSLLLTGDLGEDAQNAILAAGPLPAVDVIKVAHHGSADQSPAFYAATAARLGVISVGAGNDYGHPTRRLLGILRADGIRPVRTDQQGLVLVGWRDGRLVLWTEHPSTAAVWTPAK